MLRFLIILFWGMLLLTNCSDSPTRIERDNPDDPESSTFSLEPSDNISTEILEDGIIKISWQDSVEFADHYILSKSLNSTDDFMILDTIDIQTKEYLDLSGKINLQTRYLIYNQRIQKDGRAVSSDSLYTEINFGNLSYPDSTSYFSSYNSDTTAIKFTWDYENDWPFISLVYYFDSIDNESVIIDTLYDVKFYKTPTFVKDFNKKKYDIRFFVSEEDFLDNILFGSLSSGYDGTTKFTPYIKDLYIVNENEVRIKWNDNSYFEDGFEILRNQKASDDFSNYEVVGSVGPNETTFTDTLAPFDSYTRLNNTEVKYGIRGIKGNSSSASYGSKALIPKINPVLGVTNLDNDSFTLSWSTESNFVKEYILQISFDGIVFEDYKVFPKNITSYTESNLDFPASLISFKIKTTTSTPSSHIGLSYSPELIEEDYFSFEGSRNFRFSGSGNLVVAAKGSFFNPLELGVSIYDLNSNSIIYSKNLLNSSIHGIDIDETNKRVAVGSTTNRSVAVYDYEADTLIYLKNSISVYDVHFSNNGNTVYSNSSRGILNKHNLVTKEIEFRKSDGVASSQANIRKLSISPTGDSIAYNISGFLNISDTLGNTIAFNNLSNLGDISQDIRFSKKGSYLSLTNRSLGAFIYKAKTNEKYFEFGSRYVSIDRTEKLAIAGNSYKLHLLDLKKRKLINTYTFDEQITNLAFSPTEDLFAIGTSSGIRFYSLSKSNSWREIDSSFDLKYPIYE